MFSIKRIITTKMGRIVKTTLGAVIFLIGIYLIIGIDRGLGERNAIYQLFFPNTFYSVLALVNVFFVTIVSPAPNVLEQIRFWKKEDGFKTVILWINLSCLWTAILASSIIQILIWLLTDSTRFYWPQFLLTIFLAFENFLFFQSIILVISLLIPRINYFFVNCIVYLVIAGALSTALHNYLVQVFFGSQFLLHGQMLKLGLQSLIMWGIIILCWLWCLRLYTRRDSL